MSFKMLLVAVAVMACVSAVAAVPLPLHESQQQLHLRDPSGYADQPDRPLRQFFESAPYQTVFDPLQPLQHQQQQPVRSGSLPGSAVYNDLQNHQSNAQNTKKSFIRNPHVPDSIASLNPAYEIANFEDIPVVSDPTSLLPAVSYEENFAFQQRMPALNVGNNLPDATDPRKQNISLIFPPPGLDVDQVAVSAGAQPTGEVPTETEIPAAIARPTGTQDIPAAIAPPTGTQDIPAAIAPPTRAQDIPAAIAPPTRTQGIPAAIAPPTGTQAIPAAIAPPTRTQGIPAAIAPPTRTQGIPAAIAPPTRIEGLPAAIVPPTRVDGLPAAIAPITQTGDAIPAAIAPLPAAIAPLPAAIAPLPAAIAPLPAAIAPLPAAIAPLPAAIAPLPAAIAPLPAAIAPPTASGTGDVSSSDVTNTIGAGGSSSANSQETGSTGGSSVNTQVPGTTAGSSANSQEAGTTGGNSVEVADSQSNSASPPVEVSQNSIEQVNGSVEIQLRKAGESEIDEVSSIEINEEEPEVEDVLFNYREPLISFTAGDDDISHIALQSLDTVSKEALFDVSKRDTADQDQQKVQDITDNAVTEGNTQDTTINKATEEVEPTTANTAAAAEVSVTTQAPPQTKDEVIAALESNTRVLDAKYNFFLAWNNEVARQGLYMLRIANVYPQSGYVYMPDVEYYTRLIKSSPAVLSASTDLSFAWESAKQNLTESIETNGTLSQDISDLLSNVISVRTDEEKAPTSGSGASVGTGQSSQPRPILLAPTFPIGPFRSNLENLQNYLHQRQSGDLTRPLVNQQYYTSTFPGYVTGPYQYFQVPSGVGMPFPGYYPRRPNPSIRAVFQAETRPADSANDGEENKPFDPLGLTRPNLEGQTADEAVRPIADAANHRPNHS